MIHITKRENMVLNRVKYFQSEYTDGVPFEILKLDLEISEMELKDILEVLEDKKIVSQNDDHIKLKKSDEINVLESKAEVKREELDDMEEKAFEIMKKLGGESKLVSRYLMEGELLYGELKLSTQKTYKLIITFEKKGLIKKVQRKDGEYYAIQSPI